MNRRGILGALAAAPFAGPEAAKMAAQQGTPANFGGLYSGASQAGTASSWFMEPDEAIRRAFNLGIISRGKLVELIAPAGLTDHISEYNLDPDLRAAKSFSLATRIRMQRQRGADRSVERFLSKPASMWDFGRDLLTKGIIKDGAA